LRVIAGQAKGRKLLRVPGSATRPISSRVKEALFGILGSDIEGAAFLDLFAGTGSVGIEALSRGASKVVFVDRSRKAIDTVRRNLQITRLAGRAEVIHRDVFRFLEMTPASLLFDYIYVAPPQYQDLWDKTLLALNDKPLLAMDGLIVVQMHPKEFRQIDMPRLQPVQQRRYGSTLLCFYRCQALIPY
jgi:16S rRNA (guanine(966)-N(2))-methyltransferase RsmD